MIDREPSRFRSTPFGKGWRDFWFEVPEPFKRLNEWMWSKASFRRSMRRLDNELAAPHASAAPISSAVPGRPPLLSDEEYSLDDDAKAVELQRLRALRDRETPGLLSEVPSFFKSRGFELNIEEHDLHAEYTAGDAEQASSFAEGRRYFCVDLMREGRVVERQYGVALTKERALLEAQYRFESEHA